MTSRQRAYVLPALCCFAAAIGSTTWAGEVIDKTVAVVGLRAITASEVAEQIALESFSEGTAVDDSDKNLREALERLIRRRLVFQEIAVANFTGVSDKEAQLQLEHQKRLSGGARKFHQSVQDYGLSEEKVSGFLRQQLDFERFVDFRFKTGQVPARDEVVRYYKEIYLAALERINRSETLEQAYPIIEQTLIEQRVDPLLENWVREVRARTRIEILDESLQPPQR